MSACNIVWRSQLYVQINLEKYLDSTVFSDVEFVVQSERYLLTRTIRAHKQFLAMRNDVFGTMFFGSLPEKDRVCITDLHPSGFYGLLKSVCFHVCLVKSVTSGYAKQGNTYDPTTLPTVVAPSVVHWY
ncbi:hypothetical protein HPB49_013436 [Dermacentor silvarum]|uniref:Uncharacterized protein n=1 Tax=Dermacentor silvarum TaxID=543639 RepID=A0ACB8C9R4_DERSI|nr:hypothetical protein HPB49_013436 [Dermacentor silvarum]